MLSEIHHEQLVIDRCWTIYELITSTFTVNENFLVNFISDIESVLLTYRLYFKITIAKDEYYLIIQEEYNFHFHELAIENYSYILTDKTEQTLIWSDPAPHHKTDYRGQNLTHYPHHLHDPKGKIRNFSGKIEDFLREVAKLIR